MVKKDYPYAQATIPDVILLDLMLPKLNGFDLLKCLRAQPDTQHIPVMIFSALGDSPERKQAAGPRRHGIFDQSVQPA